MAQFSDMVLTNAGRGLIARTMTGKGLQFTRAVAGSGVVTGYETIPDPSTDHDKYIEFMNIVAEFSELVQPIREMEIRGIDIPPQIGTATIKTLLSNEGCSLGFFFNEVGLFAKDPDTDEEVLYGYCSAGNKGDFMPGQGTANAVKYYFDLVVVIGQAESVTAIFASDPASVTVTELDDRIDAALKYAQAQHEILQTQIDYLAEASIKKSLAAAERNLNLN